MALATEFATAAKLTEGLGAVYSHEDAMFEWRETKFLMGWVMDGDTFGTVSPLSWIAGFEDNQQALNVQVYPNPTGDFVVVAIDELSLSNAAVEIIDLSGRTILNQSVSSKQERIDLTGLNAGLYVLRLATDRGSFKSRISVVK